MGKDKTNNSVFIAGRMCSGNIRVERLSGTADIIPVRGNGFLKNESVIISGRFKSENVGNRLCLFIVPDAVEYTKDNQQANEIKLKGRICKKPTFRTTPQGRWICDLLVAVDGDDGDVDFVPCVAWGKNAVTASLHTVGTAVDICGRIQSREYLKNGEIKTAYEVSINKIGTL